MRSFRSLWCSATSSWRRSRRARERGSASQSTPAKPCRVCAPCVAGLAHLCLNLRFAGHGTTDGALRTWMTWPDWLLHAIPDTVLDAEGTLLEPLGVALHALDLGRIRPGMTVGVFGCGPIGLLLVQALSAAGAAVVLATDRLPHRVKTAVELGAAHGIVAHGGAVEAGVHGGAVRAGVDVAFEVAGADAAIDDAIVATRPGGRVVLIGIPAGDRTSFKASVARRKGLTLLVSRRMEGRDLPRAIRLVESGGVRLGPLVTGRYALAEWPEAFAALQDQRGLKVIVNPGEPRSARAA